MSTTFGVSLLIATYAIYAKDSVSCGNCYYDFRKRNKISTNKCNHQLDTVKFLSPFLIISIASDIVYYLKK